MSQHTFSSKPSECYCYDICVQWRTADGVTPAADFEEIIPSQFILPAALPVGIDSNNYRGACYSIKVGGWGDLNGPEGTWEFYYAKGNENDFLPEIKTVLEDEELLDCKTLLWEELDFELQTKIPPDYWIYVNGVPLQIGPPPPLPQAFPVENAVEFNFEDPATSKDFVMKVTWKECSQCCTPAQVRATFDVVSFFGSTSYVNELMIRNDDTCNFEFKKDISDSCIFYPPPVFDYCDVFFDGVQWLMLAGTECGASFSTATSSLIDPCDPIGNYIVDPFQSVPQGTIWTVSPA